MLATLLLAAGLSNPFQLCQGPGAEETAHFSGIQTHLGATGQLGQGLAGFWLSGASPGLPLLLHLLRMNCSPNRIHPDRNRDTFVWLLLPAGSAQNWESMGKGRPWERKWAALHLEVGGPGKTLSLQVQTVPRDGYRLVRGRLRGSGEWKAAEAPQGKAQKNIKKQRRGLVLWHNRLRLPCGASIP